SFFLVSSCFFFFILFFYFFFFFFFQAEDGIRDLTVTGVQTCALPIWRAAQAYQTCRRPTPNGSPFSSPPQWSWTSKSNRSCLRRAPPPSDSGASARCLRKWSATTKSAPAPTPSHGAMVTPANTSTSTNDR